MNTPRLKEGPLLPRSRLRRAVEGEVGGRVQRNLRAGEQYKGSQVCALLSGCMGKQTDKLQLIFHK